MSLWNTTDDLASKPKYLTKKITFDGSSTDVVHLVNNTIKYIGHGYATGTPVIYTSSSAITGLTSTNTYYVIRGDADLIMLASSYALAIAGTAVNLTVLGGATDDTIQEKAVDVYFADANEVSAGGDNVVDVSIATGGAGYREVPVVSFTTPSASDVTVSGTTTGGVFACSSGTLAKNDRIIISGTNSGSGTIAGWATGKAYRVASVTGASPSNTAFTLVNDNFSPVVTSDTNGGTFTGLTFGAGTGAAATAVVTSGAVSSATVTNVGSGYGQAPGVSIVAPRLTIPTSGVTIATESIAYTSHGMTAGTSVVYMNGGATTLAGLESEDEYFVSSLGLTADAFRLAGTVEDSAVRTFPLTVPIEGAAVSGTDGQFTCTARALATGNKVIFAGTNTGTGTIAAGIYKVSAITGVSPDVTGFTLTTEADVALTGLTVAGTIVGMTRLVSQIHISGTGGQFTCANTTLAANDRIAITGTYGGTGSITGYSTGTIYKVSAVTGTSPDVTGFTLTTEAGGAIVTTIGVPTGLTYNAATLKDLTGTGNNAQYFIIGGAIGATAVAELGSKSTITHSGWVKRTAGFGGRAGRVFYETIVATGTKAADSSDASDDIVLPD